MKTLDFRIVELHYTKTHEVVHLKSQPQGFLKCNFIVSLPLKVWQHFDDWWDVNPQFGPRAKMKSFDER